MIWSFTSVWWGIIAKQPQKQDKMAWASPASKDESMSLQEFDIDDSSCPLLFHAASENSRFIISCVFNLFLLTKQCELDF